MKSVMILLAALLLSAATVAQAPPAGSDKPFVVEYYYKTKWGHTDEFLRLFKKNHYPLLKKEVEMGRMLKVWMDQTRYHATEDGRWDYRVTIVFRNAAVANEPFDEEGLKKKFLEYISLRAEGWRLTAKGLRAGDRRLVEQGNAKQKAAKELLEPLTNR